MRASTVLRCTVVLSGIAVIGGVVLAAGASAASAAGTGTPDGRLRQVHAERQEPAPAPARAAAAPSVVPVVPAVPFVRSVAAEGLSVLVGWAPNDPANQVTQYTVTATPSAGSTSTACPAPVAKSVPAPASDSAVVVDSLCAAVVYTVNVKAVNVAGSSAASPSSAPVVPLAAQVPQAPMVTSVVARSGQLLVAWSPPAVTGGTAISGYTVTAKTGTVTTATVNPAASSGSATLSGLANGTAYTVAVTAQNATGSSAAGSGTGTPKPAYAPGPPQAFTTAPTGSGSVAITWQAPADDGGSALTGYGITYQHVVQNSAGMWTPAAGAPVHSLTAGPSVISAAAPASSFETASAFYLFSVNARNAVGTGTAATAQAPVAPVTGTTNKQVVLSAAAVTALTAVGATSLTWASPPPAEVAAITVGKVLVAAPGGLLPEGGLRTVTSIDTGTSGSYVLHTAQASLQDVFTNMSLDTAMNPVDGTTTGSTGSTGGSAARAGQRLGFRATAPGVRVLPQAIIGTVGVEKSITLAVNLKEGAATIGMQANLTSSVKVEINVHTGFAGIPNGAAVTSSAKVVGTLSGNAQVKGEYSKKVGEIVGAPIDIQLGPVPLVLVPKVPVFLTASGEIGVGVSVSMTLGGSVGWDSAHPGDLSVQNLTTAPRLSGGIIPGVTATGSVSIGLKVQPQVDIEGIAGPNVEADLTLQADANFNPGPADDFLTITPSVEAKAGVDVDVFGITASLEVTVGVYPYPVFVIHAAPSANYTIAAPATAVAVGSTLALTATRSDAVVATRTWTLIGGSAKDVISSSGVFTPAAPAGRTVIVAVADATGAAGQFQVSIGAAYDSPGPVSATQVTGSSLGATITWRVPTNTGGRPLASFTVLTQPSTGTHTVGESTTSLSLTDLAPGNYAIAVYATNTDGVVSASAGTSLFVTPTCTATWNGPDGGNWGTATNWSPAHVPGTGDWVCLRSAKVSIPAATNVSVSGFDADSTTVLIGGGLTVGSYASVTGTLSGAGTVTFPAASRAVLADGASLVLAGGVKLLNRGTLEVGTTGYCACDLHFSGGSVLDNQARISLNDYGDLRADDSNASNRVINESGATIASVGSGAASIGLPLTSDGTLTAQAGTLSLLGTTALSGRAGGPGGIVLAGDTTLSPSFSFAGGSDVSVTGNLTLPSSFTFAGVKSLSLTGTVSGLGTFTFPAVAITVSGTLSGAGTVTLPAGSVTVLAAGSPVTLAGDLKLVNKGSLSVGGASSCGCGVTLAGGSVLDNQATINLRNYVYLSTGGSSSAGQLINEAGATIAFTDNSYATIGVPFANSGMVSSQTVGGMLSLAGPNTLSGRVSGPGAISLSGTTTVSSSFTLVGSPVLSVSGELYVPSSFAFLGVKSLALTGEVYGLGTFTFPVVPLTVSGTLSGAGTVTLPPSSVSVFASGSPVTLAGGLRLVNKGSLTVGGVSYCGCTFSLADGAVLDNQATINLRNYVNVSQSDGNPAEQLINEAGATIAFTDTSYASISVPLTSSGTITSQTVGASLGLSGLTTLSGNVSGPGAISLGGTTTLSSSFTMAGSPVLSVTGELYVPSSFAFAGVKSLTLAGEVYGLGTFTFPVVPITVSGTLSGAGTVTLPPSSVSVFASSSSVTLAAGLKLVNRGSLTVGGVSSCGCTFSLADGAVLDNQATINLRNYVNVSQSDGNPAEQLINEAGATIAFTDTTYASISVPLTNSGTITSQTVGGSLGLAGPTTLSGKVSGPGAISLGGTTTILPPFVFSGGPALSVSGGLYVPSSFGFTGVNSLTVTGSVYGLGTFTLPVVPITVSGRLSGSGTVTLPAGAASTFAGNSSVTLAGGLTLVNKGTLTVGRAGGCSCSVVLGGGSKLDNQATINLHDYAYLSRSDSNPTAQLINEAAATIAFTDPDYASIAVPLTNNGTITSQTASGSLGLSGTSTLSGKVSGPGGISLSGTTTILPSLVFSGAPGLQVAGELYLPSTFGFAGVSSLAITGEVYGLGTFTLPVVPVTVSGTLSGAGTVTLPTGSAPVFAGNGSVTLTSGLRLVNKGTLSIGRAGGCSCTVVLAGGAVLDNQGNVTLHDYAYLSRRDNNPAEQVINEAGATIAFTDGNYASINVPLTSSGTLSAGSGILTLSQLTNLTSGTLTGGTLQATGQIVLPGPIVTNNGAIVIGAAGSLIDGSSGSGTSALAGLSSNLGSLTTSAGVTTAAALTNRGALSVKAGTTQAASYLQSAGTTTLAAGAVLKGAATCAGALRFDAGTLSSAGTLCGSVTAAGAVTPGPTAAQLSVTGPFSATSTTATSLVVGLAGTTVSAGHLSATGAVTLAGSLAVAELAGYDPPIGTRITVVSGAGLTGAFASVASPGLTGKKWVASYTGATAVLTMTAA